MSIEAAIHSTWSASGALNSAIPAATSVMTGYPRLIDSQIDVGNTNPALPFVSLERIGSAEVTRTSSRRIETVTMRFFIYHTGSEALQRVVKMVDTAFDRLGFTYTDGEVLDMKRTNRSEQQLEDGTWLGTIDFQVRTAEPNT